MWTYQMPSSMTEEQVRELFASVADRYLGIPGLVRKYFGYGEGAREVVTIYLWHSQADADAFHTPAWIADAAARWGAAPTKQAWTVPVVAESALGAVITR